VFAFHAFQSGFHQFIRLSGVWAGEAFETAPRFETDSRQITPKHHAKPAIIRDQRTRSVNKTDNLTKSAKPPPPFKSGRPSNSKRLLNLRFCQAESLDVLKEITRKEVRARVRHAHRRAVHLQVRITAGTTRRARHRGDAALGRAVSALWLSADPDLSQARGPRDEYRPGAPAVAPGGVTGPAASPATSYGPQAIHATLAWI
jgi:hypothetical protein